jgi:hypothetical protein
VRRLLVGVLLLLGHGARADWKDVSVTLTPAYALVNIDDRSANGGGFAVDLGLGLSDALSLHATSALGWHAAPATKMLPAGTLSAFTAMLGLTYTLDVIRLVPSFDVAFGAIGVYGDATFGSTPGAAAVSKPVTGFGVSGAFMLDYLLTRHVAVGAEVRYHAVLTDLSRVPMYLYAGPRVTFRWGH